MPKPNDDGQEKGSKVTTEHMLASPHLSAAQRKVFGRSETKSASTPAAKNVAAKKSGAKRSAAKKRSK